MHAFTWFLSLYIFIQRSGCLRKAVAAQEHGTTMGSATALSLWHDARSSRPAATLFFWHYLSTESGQKVGNAHRLPAVRDNLGSSFFKSGRKAHGDGVSAPASFSSKRS